MKAIKYKIVQEYLNRQRTLAETNIMPEYAKEVKHLEEIQGSIKEVNFYTCS